MQPLIPQGLSYHTKRIQLRMPFIEAFVRLSQQFTNSFLLESLEENERVARYSVIGFNPLHHVWAKEGTLSIDGAPMATADPYGALRECLGQERLPTGGFSGGLVGYFSYEATRYFEPSLTFHPAEFPDFEFGLYLDGLVLNRLTGDTYYFFLQEDRSALVEEALARDDLRSASLKPPEAEYLGSNVSFEEHVQQFQDAMAEIHAGNSYQLQISRKFRYRVSGSKLPIYLALREMNPSPHMFYLRFGERELIGSSPEIVVRLERGLMEVIPIAGTRRRGTTADEDHALAEELLNDPKERAEHMMLVDLARNDVGRLCTFGTVQVRRLMYLLRFSHVQHIVTDVEGRLDPRFDMFDVYAASSPAGTVTGAPKIESMKIINRIEREGRGPYSGAVGYFSLSGDCYFAIAIRSLFARGPDAWVQAACGIVYDSEAEREFQEVENKSLGVRRAIERASVVRHLSEVGHR
ncbi:MAG: anthranilate synthase component I family protein [Chloroflexi bacterium]|nr:anthranilate synthase component I family protein [Chloroflexota bacterium]